MKKRIRNPKNVWISVRFKQAASFSFRKIETDMVITKTRLFKYIENSTIKKMKTFRWKILLVVIFPLKT